LQYVQLKYKQNIFAAIRRESLFLCPTASLKSERKKCLENEISAKGAVLEYPLGVCTRRIMYEKHSYDNAEKFLQEGRAMSVSLGFTIA
jgi:hypothetical protein